MQKSFLKGEKIPVGAETINPLLMVVLDEMRGARQNYRANRRARSLTCRGRTRPRRLGLSKVVDVVSNSNDALSTTVGSKFNGKYSAVREATRLALVLFEDADLACPCCGSDSCLGRAA